MIVGVLSDTHGNVRAALAAVRILRDRGAVHLIHCGDVGEENVLDTLVDLPASFVFGNNDWDHAGLRRYAGDLGIECLGDSGIVTVDGHRLAVTHGDNPREITCLSEPDSGNAYLFTGHSHRPHDKTVGTVRWINPGALYRAAVKTVAVVDLKRNHVEWIEVPGV